MFVVRNYQSDDRPHGEDPNLFNEIVSQCDSMGRQLDILIYFHLKKQISFFLFPTCETDKAQCLEFLVFYSDQIKFGCSNGC